MVSYIGCVDGEVVAIISDWREIGNGLSFADVVVESNDFAALIFENEIEGIAVGGFIPTGAVVGLRDMV
jgi:hypothetical protein